MLYRLFVTVASRIVATGTWNALSFRFAGNMRVVLQMQSLLIQPFRAGLLVSASALEFEEGKQQRPAEEGAVE